MPRNSLARAVGAVQLLPPPLRRRAITLLFNTQVRFAGTAGLRFEALDADQAIVVIRNRRAVQNHIGGVHAAAMALLAETATGALFGLNLQGGSLPLLKSMQIDYLRCAQGELRAHARLDAAARAHLAGEPRGELIVPVTVSDASGASPIRVQMCWAWVPKRR